VISAQLPALQVVVPLLAAPLCLVLHRPFAAWLLTFVVSGISLLVSVALLGQILEQGVIDSVWYRIPHRFRQRLCAVDRHSDQHSGVHLCQA